MQMGASWVLHVNIGTFHACEQVSIGFHIMALGHCHMAVLGPSINVNRCAQVATWWHQETAVKQRGMAKLQRDHSCTLQVCVQA